MIQKLTNLKQLHIKYLQAIMTDGDAKLHVFIDQFNEKNDTNIVHLRDFVHGHATIQKIIKSIYSDVTVEELPELIAS